MNIKHPLDDTKGHTSNKPQFLHVNFNQDDSCFSCALEDGFRIYNTNPLQVKLTKKFTINTNTKTFPSKVNGTGIGYTRMLYRTNYIALLGGGTNPKYPMNKLIIWDDLLRKESMVLKFMSIIKEVYLSRSFIIVQFDKHFEIYNFKQNPKKLFLNKNFEIKLGSNIDFKVSNINASIVQNALAFVPPRTRGQIQIARISSPSNDSARSDDSDVDEDFPTLIIKAHKSDIRLIKLNHQGTMIASCSEKGTIIRIFSTHNGSLIKEFRRGIDSVEIYDMEFSPKGNKLAIISDKQTLHIFQVYDHNNQFNKIHRLEKSNWGNWNKNLNLKYFDSVWSMCSIHLQNPKLLLSKPRNNSISDHHTNNTSGKNNLIDLEFEKDRCKIGWCNNSTQTSRNSVRDGKSSKDYRISDDADDDNDNDNDEEDSLVLVWKDCGIWEKYVILEKDVSTTAATVSNKDNHYSVNESLRTENHNNNINE
ncbi:phosphatidylinositol-3,5-bisphosphate binding protein HSV2 NDAI_0D02470 [Naumovozyma dairenensis CBS 421]|uniref:Uncharacterized protein n=1 Tax=Naumovozyma dairenensis (strain ATCC 10597 / BCRC 20456 / CBS 421 / NBRC 0211 / NRRL Y-12639) TaxID=1071378 RepID=G0W9V0_NAUDC|nr:hypothetical protein NDAI_0D02470 [Naumovozyma dairenensis CBS 421]CCD24561.1 hypothetical protein NDAI_0D02470 [Naumovozyma dairenensis CBS 421]